MKKTWSIPPHANAESVAAMENVLTVYQRLYDAARPLICLDEAAKQWLADVRAIAAWQQVRNRHAVRVNWRFAATSSPVASVGSRNNSVFLIFAMSRFLSLTNS